MPEVSIEQVLKELRALNAQVTKMMNTFCPASMEHMVRITMPRETFYDGVREWAREQDRKEGIQKHDK